MMYHIDILASESIGREPAVIRTIKLEAGDVNSVADKVRHFIQGMPGWAPKGAGFRVKANGEIVHTWFESMS
jgi:hypothetical protein